MTTMDNNAEGLSRQAVNFGETRLDRLARRVITFYASHPPMASQIQHTQSVAHFTRIIAINEGLSADVIQMQEMAAWLHDVGCPIAKSIYGNSRPVHQECEGEKLVHEWLDGSTDFSQGEIDWLGHAVGGHHRLQQALTYHFEPLYEADLIVNLFEGYYKLHQVNNFMKHMVTTDSGKTLFHELFAEQF